uniref:Uncharacterized protein n=1 Tax=Candidatus Kentrum sp. TC TaxID=2126339 RepID=A0A450YCT0_9GAMM|nr:MAG: hypothetical protein BECKTC1821E_GA0114239_100469 [Candidatus Kentron sp. TC]
MSPNEKWIGEMPCQPPDGKLPIRPHMRLQQDIAIRLMIAAPWFGFVR